MIDPTFRNVDRLFVVSFENGGNDPMRYSFDKYWIPLVAIKGFNVSIENKIFFDQPVKNKQETFEKKQWFYNREFIRFSYYLPSVCRDKKIRIFLKNLYSQEN